MSLFDSAFWRGRPVLVTGHTGFKGAWLSLWLSGMGAEVHGYALQPPTDPSLFALSGVEKGLASHTVADIDDLSALQAAMGRARPELVIHLAAQSLVRQSYHSPVDTYRTNVQGTVHVLEAVRHQPGVRAVLCVTSDKCYQNKEWCWGYRESDPLGGHDPYSNSKAAAELIAASYRSAFFPPEAYGAHGVAVATARAGNVIGGGDWAADRLLPDLVMAFMRGEQPLIRSPDAVRPWQHVLDCLAGYLLLCRHLLEHGPEFAEAWNFGPERASARSVRGIADLVAGEWSDGAAWRLDGGCHPRETAFLYLDVAKAAARLGYAPCWDVVRSIRHTVAWYKAYAEGADMAAVTGSQIAQFMSEAPAA